MSETKTIAVVGAAGATSGGLARAILADPSGGYACRAITRTPDSAAARALADQGATVVRADLVAQGMTNRQIASELFLSERTAQNHVQHILDKLDLPNRSQIAVWVRGRSPERSGN